jgi:NAD(P)-dependent dehydrogenase (short-subunit alcohol dehydrogenase family)
MSGTLLVLGGRSEIGLAVARRLAGREASTVVLAARPRDEPAPEIAGATVQTRPFDADDLASHRPLLDEVAKAHNGIDVAVVAFGILGDQARAEVDAAHAVQIVHTDYVAHVQVLTELAQVMRAQGHGTIVVFSSVAGARVRRANYVYGSSKAGLDGFASGLADALHGSGVRLVLVRPGFVIGRMTEGMTPAPFSSTPDQVADATVAALRNGRDEVWVPRVLRPAFALLKHAPRALWRRMPR